MSMINESLFDQVAQFDPLLAVRIKAKLDALSERVEELESCPRCAYSGEIIASLTDKLAASRRAALDNAKTDARPSGEVQP